MLIAIEKIEAAMTESFKVNNAAAMDRKNWWPATNPQRKRHVQKYYESCHYEFDKTSYARGVKSWARRKDKWSSESEKI